MLKALPRRATTIKRPLCSRRFGKHAPSNELEIGYVPEHYCGPLHLARPYLEQLLPSTTVKLRPFPSGTGHMIEQFKSPSSSLDLAIGLTESWVGGMLNCATTRPVPYRLVGEWVSSPLRWAIVTGHGRKRINHVKDLKYYNKAAVSRLGSGSHVMAMMLAQQEGWLPPKSDKPAKKVLDIRPEGPFKNLVRAANNMRGDFFMWEHFTAKPSFTGLKARLKKIGEMYAPWPAWMIAAREDAFPEKNYEELKPVFEALNKGLAQFMGDKEKTVEMLGTGELECKYGAMDATEWINGMEFTNDVRGINVRTIEEVAEKLRLAGFTKESGGWGLEELYGITRSRGIGPESGT